jgi:1,4-alpha-glucan branching enzyme
MTTGKKSSTTTLCIILHAHLPYVRDAKSTLPLEEIWLYQNIAECYIPLIQMCQRLIKKNIRPSLAISISPTLLTMLTQQYYHIRFKHWAHTILECIEILKRKNRKAKRSLNFYDNFVTGALTYFESIHGDCAVSFGELFKNNSIELMTTAATHPFLPLYRNYPVIQDLQIMAGLHEFEKKFGTKPEGFWLPEMGIMQGLI